MKVMVSVFKLFSALVPVIYFLSVRLQIISDSLAGNLRCKSGSLVSILSGAPLGVQLLS